MAALRSILLNNLSIKTFSNHITFRNLSTSSSLSGHWFTNGRKPSQKRIREKAYPYDWEHGVWQPLPRDELIPHANLLKNLDQADEIVKQFFTYAHSNAKEESDAQIQQALDQHADPQATNDKGRLIITYTVLIQKYKFQLTTNHKSYKIKKMLKCLINARKILLDEYRTTNYNDFERLCDELRIDFQHHNPFNYADLSEEHYRAKAIKKQFYNERKQRFDQYQQEVENEKTIIKSEKEKLLPELSLKLSKLGLSLETVFQDVVRERRDELLEPVRADRHAWFEREKELKIYYAKIRADKLERRMKAKRR